MSILNEVMTTKEVAAFLKIAPNKVYKLRKEDPSFPYHNLNGALRYVYSEVIDWVKTKERSDKYLEEKHLQEN